MESRDCICQAAIARLFLRHDTNTPGFERLMAEISRDLYQLNS